MGGKSRKSGKVSKALIQRIKNGGGGFFSGGKTVERTNSSSGFSIRPKQHDDELLDPDDEDEPET